jgi:glutaconate CoA-transferase subunit B
LQPGRIETGLLGAAQVDRVGNLNSTVIGSDYLNPKVRLPGAGGAPEIASACQEVSVILNHGRKAFPEKVDFITSVGHGKDMSVRGELGFTGQGPVRVITDLGVLEMSTTYGELVLTVIHPEVDIETVINATGWDLRVSPDLKVTPEPTQPELETLRELIRTSSTR